MAIFNSKLLNNYKPQGHHLARETPGQFGLVVVVVVVPLAPQRLRRRQRQGPVFVAFGKPWKVGNAVGWFYGKNHGDNLSQYGMWDPYNYRVFYGSNHGRNPIISIRCDNIWYMIYDIHIYIYVYTEVSCNGGTLKSSIYRWIFHHKPSTLGYPHLWNIYKTPTTIVIPALLIGTAPASRLLAGSLDIISLVTIRVVPWVFVPSGKLI